MTRALIIGCAKAVWEEVALAREFCNFDEVYCVKMAGIDWPGGRFHWVTLHPEYMSDYILKRQVNKLHEDFEIVAPLASELREGNEFIMVDRRVAYRFEGQFQRGSSGLYGVKVALDDGADQVVLAGIPMEATRGHYLRGHDNWEQCHLFELGWKEAMPHLIGRVKSMSGWTAEQLGYPTTEWLNGEQAHA